MNKILTGRVHGEVDLRTKNAPRRYDGSQKRFLTQQEDELFVQSLLLEFTEKERLEGKPLRKGDALKNVITLISQEEKRGKSRGIIVTKEEERLL